jgi:hypothetical protein
MAWVLALISILFVYTGVSNIRRGDDGTAKKLPFPRRSLGAFQLFIGLIVALVSAGVFLK